MNDGIDISGVNPVDPAGTWLFCVVKLSEALALPNKLVDQQWAAASRHPYRGFYHYARPRISTPQAQAAKFCTEALARGFEPNVDMFQLDCESQGNEAVSGAEWRTWIDTFMPIVLGQLGRLGFVYCGYYFFRDQIQPERYHWWLPWYGPNDGKVYPIPSNVNPVIQQYTSVNGLDRNVIHDQQTWQKLVGTQPPAPEGTVQLVAQTNQDGRMELFALNADGKLTHCWRHTDGTWNAWVSFPGGPFDALELAKNDDGRLELFAHPTAGGTQHCWQTAPNNGWSDWKSLQ